MATTTTTNSMKLTANEELFCKAYKIATPWGSDTNKKSLATKARREIERIFTHTWNGELTGIWVFSGYDKVRGERKRVKVYSLEDWAKAYKKGLKAIENNYNVSEFLDFNLGANCEETQVIYTTGICRVEVDERREEYCKSCSFAKIVRDFYLFIPKGYKKIGKKNGFVIFSNGKKEIKIKQGREISKFEIIK